MAKHWIEEGAKESEGKFFVVFAAPDGIAEIASEHDTKEEAKAEAARQDRLYAASIQAERSEQNYIRACERACGIED